MSKNKLVYINSDIDKKIVDFLSTQEEKDAYIKYRKEFYEASNFKKRFDYPIHVDIELNNSCNYRCSFCEFSKPLQNRSQSYQNKESFNKEEIFSLLEHLKSIGTKSIQFNLVNEPLLYKNLIDVVKYASKLKFPDIYFITNASLLDNNISKELLKSGLTKIMFSLDANSCDTYKKIRQKDNFEKVKQNILDFLEIKSELNLDLPVTRVSFVMTDINRNEKEEFEEYWKNKVDFIAFQSLINLENQNKESQNKIKQLKNYRCNMPYFRIAIRPNGNVSPCCVFYGEQLVLGNVKNNNISNIWNSDKFKHFQKLHQDYKWMENSICKECVLSTEF